MASQPAKATLQNIIQERDARLSETLERSATESAELDKYDIPVEIGVKIFREFGSTLFFIVLAPILHFLKIDEGTFSGLLQLINDLKHAEHEREAVCSSILIVRDEYNPDVIANIFFTATEGLNLDDRHEVISLAQLINGFSGAILIKSSGEVLCGCVFRSEDENADPLLPQRYRKAATASLQTEGLLFLFAGHGRISVFHNGKRILSHRRGSWHLHTNELERRIKCLSEEHSIDVGILRHVLRIAYRMSDEGLGALITVGDHEQVLAISDPPKTRHVHWMPTHLGQTNDEAVTGLMSQDGATIVANDGAIVQGMTFLRPPPGTKGGEEVGRGSRHSTAAKVSGATNAVCVAISVDGEVTVYSKGNIAFRING